jgi:hypothetical protein
MNVIDMSADRRLLTQRRQVPGFQALDEALEQAVEHARGRKTPTYRS